MKNKPMVLAAILSFTQFSITFGDQKPEEEKAQEQKSYWQIFREFKDWASGKAQTAYKKVYENAPSAQQVYENVPSAGTTAIATAGAGILLGGVRPQIAGMYAIGGYAIIQGVKQARNAILNEKVLSSLAAGTLLTAGLGMTVLPTVSALIKANIGGGVLDYAGIAVLATGLGTTAAGLIFAIYRNRAAAIAEDKLKKKE